MKAQYIVIILILIVIGVTWMAMRPSNEHAQTPVNTMEEMETNEENMSDDVIEENGDVVIDEDMKYITIDVDGFNFGYSLEEIRVEKGATVTINLTSSDGFHDWVVDEFDAATEKIQTGGNTSVTFVADKEGTFEYYCSVGQHRANGMVGNLIVE